MSWSGFQDILPVLTLAIGYAGTFATERFRDRHEARRAHRAAMHGFERTLLLDTQEALYAYAGEMQDFAFALRGEADRTYTMVVGTAWRASARLEMLSTRLSVDETRDAVAALLEVGQSITTGDWPSETDEWTPEERELLDKSVDVLLEQEQAAALLLGDRLRAVTYDNA
jgi:hypothetical protein